MIVNWPYTATRFGLALRGVGKVISGAGRLFGWLGRVVLPIVGRAIVWIGRALIANPIGAIIMGIATAAWLIYEYWAPISAFFQNLWRQVTDTFGRAVEWIASAVESVTGFDWASLLTLDGLRSAWSAVTGFLGRVLGNLWDALSPLAWAGLVRSEDLADAWKAVTGFITGIASKLWNGISSIKWGDYIPKLSWDDFVTAALKWADWLDPLSWGTWIAEKLNLASWVDGFEWSDIITTPLTWANWVAERLNLKDWIDKFDWQGIITAPFTWGNWVAERLNLASWVDAFEWSDVIHALDIRAWLDFSWADVLPDWDWGAIIPDLPDLKALFTDAGESLDVRLENRAGGAFGRQWQEGIDLVNQYRAGLIGLEEVKARLAAKVATEQDAWFNSFEVNRAEDMLALLEDIAAARGNAPAAEVATEIANPETLLEAARAASDLEARFPALAAAANETLTVVQAMIAQIVAAVAQVDLTAEGARIAGSIAAGIRARIGEVRAAAAAMSTAIRSALPGNARVNVALSAAPAPIQARASGGWYRPGWLLTGEQGPELRYATEGGFIAHNRALRSMLDMASRTSALISAAGFEGPGTSPVPALADVAAASGPTMQRAAITLSPQYNMPLSFDGRVDMEEVHDTVRQELIAAEERAQADLRRLMHD